MRARLPDPDYAMEYRAAQEAGLRCQLFSLEALRAGNVDNALADCEPAPSAGERITHRCWMMGGALYAGLAAGLIARGYVPLVSAAAYEEAHYLPLGYRHIEGRTADSVWMEGRDEDAAWQMRSRLSGSDVIIKDWVKSAKHRWKDACFIPGGCSRERFGEIFRAFLAARGHLFERGVVLRRFHHLALLAEDLKGQPVHEEYRMFFLNGELLAATPAMHGAGPFDRMAEWTRLARRYASPFITMDVAREESGNWLIIEVGDAGVSGLPISVDTRQFYESLQHRLG